ncbi:uncharacterized protein LOC116019101 [Ipomoea triloba]|uniref:uncharacterized protein LOC116019101 n=1 Tax=Ipomoea triloba TaxID=35885 RepID=UPI00125DC2C0|nr:uncharacterized protein LOC116019101 [Ipomoea triloba]
MMSAKAKTESKFSRRIKAPIRVLMRARDFYIRSLSDCSGKFGSGAVDVVGGPAPHIYSLPRSFSVASSASSVEEDMRELIRIASTKSLGGKVEAEILRRRQQPSLRSGSSAAGGGGMRNVLPRSHSVAVGRIDEDKPCDFGDIKVVPVAYPRSRSCAVSGRNRIP